MPWINDYRIENRHRGQVQDFKLSPAIKDWIDNKCVTTAILIGPAGCGKTAFAVALANKYGWKMLHVNHPHSFLKLSEEHDMIFFDHVDLDGLEDTQLQALLQTQHGSESHIMSRIIADKSKIRLIALDSTSLQKLAKKVGKEETQGFFRSATSAQSCNITYL